MSRRKELPRRRPDGDYVYGTYTIEYRIETDKWIALDKDRKNTGIAGTSLLKVRDLIDARAKRKFVRRPVYVHHYNGLHEGEVTSAPRKYDIHVTLKTDARGRSRKETVNEDAVYEKTAHNRDSYRRIIELEKKVESMRQQISDIARGMTHEKFTFEGDV